MEIEITQNNEKRKIKLNNPKGREVKKGLKLLFRAQSCEDSKEQIIKLEEYIDYIDEVSASNIGMTIDQLDELDNDEKNNIIQFYAEKINGRLDFLKSSLKQQN